MKTTYQAGDRKRGVKLTSLDVLKTAKLEELTDPKMFFRKNRKYIISLKAIKDIITYSGSRLKNKS